MSARKTVWAPMLVAAALVSGLDACSRGDDALEDRVFALVRGAVTGDDETEAGREREPTRAELDRIKSALIGFSYGDFRPVYMVPLADTGGYLHYQDVGGRGIVMYGGAVSRTLGLGDDLMGVRHAQNDPVANRTPVAEWPREVVRSYQYRRRDLDDYAITVVCVLEPEEGVFYEIVEREFPVVRVKERCRNAAREFENTYWVSDSGFIWASEQWLGPHLKTGTVEIVRPYGG